VATWSVSFPAVQLHSQVSGALPPFFMAWLTPSLKISVVFSRFVPQPLHHYLHRAPPPLRSGSATGEPCRDAIVLHQQSCCRTFISLLPVLVPAFLSRQRSVSHKWFSSVARHRWSSKPNLRPKSHNLRMRLLLIFSRSWRFLHRWLFGACHPTLAMTQGPCFILWLGCSTPRYLERRAAREKGVRVWQLSIKR
jgi:hypothetical protein